MSIHILIVEDSQELSELLSAYLEQDGFRTSCLYEGSGVEEYVRLQKPDLVLLDLMLPGKDGVEICSGIRTFSQVPVIMVTARVEEQDRLNGLDIGADDYICKPFSPREVVARVKAVLRRTGSQVEEERLLRLDPEKLRATINGVEIDCTVVEFELLSILANHPGRVYSRAQLIEKIYPDQRMVSDRTIDSHVKKLRKKISRICELELIHSVYSAGYKYEES